MRRVSTGFSILILSLMLGAVVWAQALTDQEVEKRAQVVGRALRCVVCQGESIEESGADLAGDMRKLVRRRIRAGDSNQQVMDYMRARYGDYVLLKPPVQKNTWILWFGPFLALGSAFIFYLVRLRRKPALANEDTLSEEERKRLDRLFDEKSDGENA